MSRVPTYRQALHRAHPAQRFADLTLDIVLAIIVLTWPALIWTCAYLLLTRH